MKKNLKKCLEKNLFNILEQKFAEIRFTEWFARLNASKTKLETIEKQKTKR